MSQLVHLLDDCLLPLFTLTTVLLAIGCGLMSLMGSPAHRQRTGELTLATIFGWWILACFPLPRLLPEHVWRLAYSRFGEVARVHEAVGEPELPSLGIAMFDRESLEMKQPVLTNRGSTSLAPLEDSVAGEGPSNVDGPGILKSDSDFRATDLPSVATGPSRIARIYLTGAAGALLWLACGRIRLARIRRTARRPPAWLAEMFAALAEETAEPPLLLISRHSSRPISWGTWRPTIVLPLAMARRRHRERLRMVLLHELAHVVRCDGWGNRLLCLALPALYPHPLFLWLRAQVRMAAELLADDWAAQRAGKLDYVEQLVSLAKSSAQSPAPVPLAGAVTLYFSSSQFYRRMQMLIARTCPLSVVPTARWRRSSLAVAALIAATAASMSGARPASGQQAPPADKAASQPEDPTKLPPPATPISAGASKTAESDQLPRKAPILGDLPIVGRLYTVAEAGTTENPADAGEQALRARLAAAEERIRLLEAQLKGAVGNPAPATPASGKTAPQQADKIALTRVVEDGSISYETWTTGADGRPDKLVSKTTGRPGESSIVAAKTSISQDGRVVKRFKGKDGTFTTHVYDSNTGRLIEATTVADPAATKSADGAEQPKGANKYAAATEASPQPRGASIGLDHGLSSAAATGAESAGLDLVKLATAYADALGAVEEAEVKAAAGGPENNLAAAKAALRSAQRKQELLRNLASVAADAARADLTRAQQLVRSGYATAESTTVAESRLKMLSAILQSGSSNVDPKQAAPSLKAD